LLLLWSVFPVLRQKIKGSSRGGLLTAIAIGCIGAHDGKRPAKTIFKWPEDINATCRTHSFSGYWEIIGAAIVVAVTNLSYQGRRCINRFKQKENQM